MQACFGYDVAELICACMSEIRFDLYGFSIRKVHLVRLVVGALRTETKNCQHMYISCIEADVHSHFARLTRAASYLFVLASSIYFKQRG